MDSATEDECCETAEKMGAKVRAWCDDAQIELHDVRAALEKEIRANPLQSALIALGAGVVFGLLLHRR